MSSQVKISQYPWSCHLQDRPHEGDENIPLIQKTHEVAQSTMPSFTETNGEMPLTTPLAVMYTSIDIFGFIRQMSTAFLGIVTLVHTTAAAAASAVFTYALIPFGLAITSTLGLLTSPFVINHNLKEFCAAIKEQAALLQSKLEKQDLLNEISDEITIAFLGIMNAFYYTAMSASQLSIFIVTMLQAGAAHFYHYAPILLGYSAYLVTMALDTLLSVVYIFRGVVMGARSQLIIHKIWDFLDKFKVEINQGATEKTQIKNGIKLMQEAETKNQSYLTTRVDASCLREKKGETTIVYTANGKKIRNNNGSEESQGYTYEEKKDYLEKVNKGIYSAKLKTNISRYVALAMVIAGIASVILTFVTGGTYAAILLIVSGFIFAIMEFGFLPYDSTWMFCLFRDFLFDKGYCYTKLEWEKTATESGITDLATA